MSVTMTTVYKLTAIGHNLALLRFVFNATGDNSGGDIDVDFQIPASVLAPKDTVKYIDAAVAQSDATTQTYQLYVYNTDWSLLDGGSAARKYLLSVGSGEWTNNGNECVHKPAYAITTPFGTPFGTKTVEQPHVAVVFGTNTNTKLYKTWLTLLIQRGQI